MMPHRHKQAGQARCAKNGRSILGRRPKARPDRLDGNIFDGGKRAAGGVQQVDMSRRSPKDLELITNSLYQTPPDLIEAVEKLVPNVN
jgi:hypothetical protein